MLCSEPSLFFDLCSSPNEGMAQPANKIRVPNHRGPHPEAYHREVFDRLIDATEGLSGNAYAEAFKGELKRIASDVVTSGTSLNNLLVGK